MNFVDLSVEIAGIKMQNPVMPASGTFGFGKEFSRVEGFDLSKLGAIIGKTATLKPRDGNPQPRICEHQGGMVNSIGLQGIGIERILAEEVPFMAQWGVPIILNISGFTLEEFAKSARMANQLEEISAIEINISCPNVECGLLPFGTDPKAAGQATLVVREQTDKPVIVKLTPNVEPKEVIGEIAQAVQKAGADAISMINTVKKENVGGIPVCGWSGHPIKPIALKLIKIVRQSVSVPIIGMGGISNLDDVLEFIKLGCHAVAVGTANFSNPLVMMEIIGGLEKYCQEKGINNLSQIRGTVN